MKKLALHIFLLVCTIESVSAQLMSHNPYTSFNWIQEEIIHLDKNEISVGIPLQNPQYIKALVFTNMSKLDFTEKDFEKLDTLNQLEFIALHYSNLNETLYSSQGKNRYISNVLELLNYLKSKKHVKHIYLEYLTDDLIKVLNKFNDLVSLGIKGIGESSFVLNIGERMKTLYINGGRVHDVKLPTIHFTDNSLLEHFTYAGKINLKNLEFSKCENLQEIHLIQTSGNLNLQDGILRLQNIKIAEFSSFEGNLTFPTVKELFPKLEWLKIQCNNQTIPQAIYHFETLNYLRFNECHFTSINREIKLLINLKELAITGHKGELKKISKNLFKIISLKKLYIHLDNKAGYETKLKGLSSSKGLKSLTLLEMPLENYISDLTEVEIEMLSISACQSEDLIQGGLTFNKINSIRIIDDNLFRESQICSSKEQQKHLQSLIPTSKIFIGSSYIYLEGVQY